MQKLAYYNENDPKAAAWLRELIKEGHIAPGDVDERSILDVTPMDVAGYTQCHFFAGIGGWSYALRLAGWRDERNVWTGSCPCQPFSAAGRGAGIDDLRHLWPFWAHLIRVCKPPVIFGEQVASPAGLGWLDLVHSNLEDADYAVGAADLCAAGVGAPHIRQRLYFVAESSGQRQQRLGLLVQPGEPRLNLVETVRGGEARRLAHSSSTERPGSGRLEEPRGQSESADCVELGDTSGPGSGRDAGSVPSTEANFIRRLRRLVNKSGTAGPAYGGRWACDWIPCTDGKARPVEPGTFPLAHGVPHRVGLLRGYGNAIVPEVAATFIRAYDDSAQQST